MTPGRCDLAPETVRRGAAPLQHLRSSRPARELDLADPRRRRRAVRGVMPADGFAPIRDAVAALHRGARPHPADRRQQCGDPARPRTALGLPLDRGRPDHPRRPFRPARDRPGADATAIRSAACSRTACPARNICQIGLAPFANTAKMHDDAVDGRDRRLDDRRRAASAGIVAVARRGARRGSAMSRRSWSISTST